jgi:hypothetical protein
MKNRFYPFFPYLQGLNRPKTVSGYCPINEIKRWGKKMLFLNPVIQRS